MTIIKHYIISRWKWDFDGSHAALFSVRWTNYFCVFHI